MTFDAVIIGGGISGLAVAHDLMRQRHDVLVLERQAQAGGKALSHRIGGFLMECGPSTVNAAIPAVADYTAELELEAQVRPLGAEVRRRYLLDENGLSGISTHPLGFLLSPYLPLRARLSIMAEALRPPRPGGADESVFDFTARRFGAEFARKVMDPLCAGIFMGDARRLTVADTFPRLCEMERTQGSVIRAILSARRASQPGRRLFSWAEGIGTLPRCLAARLGGRVRTGAAVRRIERAGDGLRIVVAGQGAITARAVVLAVQPHVAAGLLERLDADGAAAAGEIAAPPVTVVFLGYPRTRVAHPLDGLGYLAASDAGALISGAQFCSTMFSGRAPEDHVAIACYIGGARHPEAAGLPPAEIEQLAHAELSRVLGIAGPPVLIRSRHWPCGLPHFTAGHARRREVLSDTPGRTRGLFVTGNFLAGVSVGHCLDGARRTARQVGQYLAASGRSGADTSDDNCFARLSGPA